MCSSHNKSPNQRFNPAGTHGPAFAGAGADNGHDPLHADKRPEELSPDELAERFVTMLFLRPILRAVTGHDHCPICLGCREDPDPNVP